MREIKTKQISELVSRLCYEANIFLGEDIFDGLRKQLQEEKSPVGRECLQGLITNAEIAGKERLPICQDTGMAVIFVEYGQEVVVTGGDFSNALNEGVRQGYEKGYFRKSVVKDPFDRVNTGDNTPQ